MITDQSTRIAKEISDIRANLPALEAVLRDVEQCGTGRVVFLCGIVGYGASPTGCAVRQRLSAGLEQSGYFAGLVHSAESLGGERASWIDRLPFTQRVPRATVAHANLPEPESFDHIADAACAVPTLTKLRANRR